MEWNCISYSHLYHFLQYECKSELNYIEISLLHRFSRCTHEETHNPTIWSPSAWEMTMLNWMVIPVLWWWIILRVPHGRVRFLEIWRNWQSKLLWWRYHTKLCWLWTKLLLPLWWNSWIMPFELCLPGRQRGLVGFWSTNLSGPHQHEMRFSMIPSLVSGATKVAKGGQDFGTLVHF